IKRSLQLAERAGEMRHLLRLVLRDLHARAERDAEMMRDLQVLAGPARPCLPIFDVVRQTLLTRVEIDRRNPLSSLQQRNGYMQRGGGFSRSTLFIAENDDVCGAGLRG